MVSPRNTRSQPRHTHRMRPGVDLCQFGVTRIWPSPISPLPCRPFRQTGLARGGVRRGATKTSHRDGTDCDLRRCGGGPPLPPHGHTFQPDFHRDFFPAFNQTTPKPKLPRLLVVGCLTRANLGWPWAGSVNSSTHTLSRSRYPAGRRRLCTTTQTVQQSLPPRQQFASIFKDATFLQPPSRTHSNTAVPTREVSDRISGFHFFFFLFARIFDDGQGQGVTEHTSHTWSLGYVTITTGTLEGIPASSWFWFWFIKRAISCLISSHLFLHIARSSCLKAHSEETDTSTAVSHLRRWSFFASILASCLGSLSISVDTPRPSPRVHASLDSDSFQIILITHTHSHSHKIRFKSPSRVPPVI